MLFFLHFLEVEDHSIFLREFVKQVFVGLLFLKKLSGLTINNSCIF